MSLELDFYYFLFTSLLLLLVLLPLPICSSAVKHWHILIQGQLGERERKLDDGNVSKSSLNYDVKGHEYKK